MQDCNISIANALELLQSCIKPSVCTCTSNMTITGHINFVLRPATQSSTYSSSFGANNAVDGDISSVAATAVGDLHPWWKVHLAYPIWVTRVEIINSIYTSKNIKCGYKEFLSLEVSKYTEQKKKRTSTSMGNLIIVRTAQRNYLVWVKSAICCESSFVKQKLIAAFCCVQQTGKCNRVNNGCDKPCASCTTRHLRSMNGLR